MQQNRVRCFSRQRSNKNFSSNTCSSRYPRNSASTRQRGAVNLAVSLLIALVVSAGLYAWEVWFARPAMVFAGVPKVVDGDLTRWQRILRSDAYVVGYSEWLGNPLWASYEVRPRPEPMRQLPRPSGFDEDWRTLRCLTQIACVDHQSYTNSGFDRGHMAPNHLIATRYGREAQHQTFLMTNITPQKPTLNQGSWQQLEALIEDELASRHGSFRVITGPVFGPDPARIGGLLGVAVPEAFYKILVREPTAADEAPKVLAFLFPQHTPKRADLSALLVAVDQIEARVGLDFFPELDDAVEDRIEAEIRPGDWELESALALQASNR